jgi:hypothetical protein
MDSSSDGGDDDDDDDADDDDDETNTDTSLRQFRSKYGGGKLPSSFNGDDGDDDNDDDHDDVDDDMDNVSQCTFSQDTLSSSASSGDLSSSAPTTIGQNDLNLARSTSNPVQPSSNQKAFGRSDVTGADKICMMMTRLACN